MYFKELVDGSFIYLLLYINDMLIAAKDMSEIDRLKLQLSSEFEMKDLEVARKIFGMEIQWDRKAGSTRSEGGIALFNSKEVYWENIKVFQYEGCQTD